MLCRSRSDPVPEISVAGWGGAVDFPDTHRDNDRVVVFPDCQGPISRPPTTSAKERPGLAARPGRCGWGGRWRYGLPRGLDRCRERCDTLRHAARPGGTWCCCYGCRCRRSRFRADGARSPVPLILAGKFTRPDAATGRSGGLVVAIAHRCGPLTFGRLAVIGVAVDGCGRRGAACLGAFHACQVPLLRLGGFPSCRPVGCRLIGCRLIGDSCGVRSYRPVRCVADGELRRATAGRVAAGPADGSEASGRGGCDRRRCS